MNDLEILKQAGIERILSSPDLRNLFHRIAKEHFGEACRNCTEKIREQYAKLFTTKPKEMGNYVMKKGAVIHMMAADWKGRIGNGDMTDEIAERLLNRSLKYIKYFDKAPDKEKILKAIEQGVGTLHEMTGEQPEGYTEKLIAINGIGERTARKLVTYYPDEEMLRDAIERNVSMEFLGMYEKQTKECLKEF